MPEKIIVFIWRSDRVMSKSMLIIDTPANCRSCKLKYDSYGQCDVCIVTDEVVDDFYKKNEKPSWCPLSPLPELKDLTKYTTVSTGSTGLEK